MKPNPWNKKVVLDLLFLALIIWVANYFYFRSFGLYEDDYAYISQSLGWHLSDLLNYLYVLVTWPQGRPLGYLLPHFLAFLGGQLGGLSTVYIIGFLVQVTNVFLFYFLLKRLGSRTSALIGAIAFGFFPADTTHIFLMHSLGLHTSLTFLLIASHCYLSDHKTISYVFGLGSLLTYESPYMVFLAVPLLGQPWDKKLVKEMIRHVAVWLGILLVVVAIRAAIGEGRIETLGSSPEHIVITLGKILVALAMGPSVSLAMFAIGPGRTLLHWNRDLTFVFLGCLAIFAWMVSRLKTGILEEKINISSAFHIKIFDRQKTLRFSFPYPQTIKLLFTSLVMLCLAYGFSFTHFPPTARYGRMTSVHLAAAFGGALLFATICSILLAYAKSHRLKNLVIVFLTLYLSLLTTYRFSIQQDFKQAWKNEQTFWTSAVSLIPDMTDGTMIFVLSHDLSTTHFILTNSWANPIMLTQIFQFPSDWKTPPRLFVVPSDWTESVVQEEGQFKWQVPPALEKSHWEVLPDSNVILLEMENGKLVRRYGSIQLNGMTLHLKPMSPNANPDWEEGTLYPLLISANQNGPK